jgi:hypothetical protein
MSGAIGSFSIGDSAIGGVDYIPFGTAGDLIRFAFRISGVAGVGQSVTADDATDALATLGMMLSQWARKRWLVYDLTETVKVSTGATSYSVSSVGDFAIRRPDRIESAFVRLLGNTGGTQVDYPLAIIESREDYNSLALKSFTAWPAAVFYDSGWPTGTLHFWPVPAVSAYELHVFTKAMLPVFSALTDTMLDLPPEYLEALVYGLVVRLTMNYGLDPRPAHVAAYRAALNTIRQANTQIPTARMPGGLPGMRRGNGSNMAAFIGGWR